LVSSSVGRHGHRLSAVAQDQSALWAFSLAVYGDPAVQQECLDLQDRYGVNVNLLLFCAFAGALHGALLSQTHVKQAEEVVRDWHHRVVENLRMARRALKSFNNHPALAGFGSFYQSIKDRELEAERLEQAMLERWSAPRLHTFSKALPSAAAEKNIATLFEICVAGGERPELPKNLIARATCTAK
jgi:uncharacterized protein (TIGR02444 family)